MVHLIVKQRAQFPSFVISVIGGYLSDETIEELSTAVKLIPRPPKTPCGHFEKTNKDEWSWTAPEKNLVERVLLLVFDKLEAQGWQSISSFTETIKDGSATTWVFHTTSTSVKKYYTIEEEPKKEEKKEEETEKKGKKEKKEKKAE